MSLFKMGENGKPQLIGEIAADTRRKEISGPGDVWQIGDQAGEPIGHFIVDDRSARCVVPASGNQ